jgi:hypothetical protein
MSLLKSPSAGSTILPLLLLGCVFPAATGLMCQAQSSPEGPVTGGPLRTDKIDLPTAINQPPDANAQIQMREEQTKPQDYAAANTERRRQIAEDTSRLLKMAAQLKAEVDKTNKDTLSLNVIREAEDIERLAHGVKEKMKLIAGAAN